jgi:hypothetical protein
MCCDTFAWYCGVNNNNTRIAELKHAALRNFKAVGKPQAREYAQLAQDLYDFVFIELRVPCVRKDASAACSDILAQVKETADGQDKFQELYNYIQQSDDTLVAPHLLRYPDFKAQATHAWASRVARRVVVAVMVRAYRPC